MDKKLLLVKPPFESFPMGMAYVLACLESNNIPCDFVDTRVERLDLRRYLKRGGYLAVATGGLIGQMDFFSEVVRQTCNWSPGLPLILGGNIVKDIKADLLFDKLGFDFGIVGEAETSLPYLINGLSEGSDDFSEIPGLVFKDKASGQVIKNMSRRLDLAGVNILPAWHRFDMDYYSKEYYLPFWGIRSAMPVLSGRGCVGQCSFCSPTVGAFRVRPIEHVIEEIEFLNSRYDFDWLVFMNEMFYPSRKAILNFCQAYQNVKPMKPWVCSLRVDADPDAETFVAMKEAGCVGISAGIESGSDKVLSLMKKKTKAEQVKNFFRLGREVGLPCCGSFMVANEGETESDLRQTIDMVIDERMNTGESLTLAYPGTLIYRHAMERGLIKNEWDYLQKIRFGCGVWEAEWVQREYPNISEIPNERFWDVLVRELRRYHSFLHSRYEARDQRYKSVHGMQLMKLSGACSECGHPTVMHTSNKLFGLETYCRNCFEKVAFNLYRLEGLAAHFELLCRELRSADRLVMLGTNSDASDILRIDYFGLDYEHVAGCLEIKGQQVSSPTFINVPRLQIDALSEIRPDVIMIVDDLIGDAELVLRLFYSNYGLELPRIVHVLPDAKRRGIRFLRLANKLNHGRSVGRIYQTALVLTIALLRHGKVISDLRNLNLGYLLVRLRKLGPREASRRLIRKISYRFSVSST